jgi:hypothetical protein
MREVAHLGMAKAFSASWHQESMSSQKLILTFSALLALSGCNLPQDYKAECARWHASREQVLINHNSEAPIVDTYGADPSELIAKAREDLERSGAQGKLDKIDESYKKKLSAENVQAFCKQYLRQ